MGRGYEWSDSYWSGSGSEQGLGMQGVQEGALVGAPEELPVGTEAAEGRGVHAEEQDSLPPPVLSPVLSPHAGGIQGENTQSLWGAAGCQWLGGCRQRWIYCRGWKQSGWMMLTV